MIDGHMEHERREHDPVADLVRFAGERPCAPPERRARVYTAARDQWSTLTGQHRRRRTLLQSFAVAAGVCVVVTAALFDAVPFMGPQPSIVATVERVIGGGLTIAAAGSGRRLSETEAAGMSVRTGETLRTADGARIALRLENGASLRLNENTELVMEGEDGVSVSTGTLYIDTGQASPAVAPLRIATPHGTVRHLGTQYEILTDPQRVRVRVREGEIVFTDSNRELRSRAGEELLIPRSAVPVRSSISPVDGAWAWAMELAVVRGDEHALPSLLSWIARETGRQIQFASSAAEAHAQTLLINGVAGYTPEETLEVLPAVTDLSYELVDELIRISEVR